MTRDPNDFFFAIILAMACTLAPLLAYIMISLIRQQRKYIKLRKENKFAEIRTLEKERMRIAIDLHDEITPILSMIKVALSSIEYQAANEPVYDGIGAAMNNIDAIIRSMREIGNNLMPQVLLRYGVPSAVEQFIANIQGKTATYIDFKYQDIPDLPEETAINMYRIIIEIIHNTLKHARAFSLRISLRTIDGELVLVTIDDGIGFKLSKMYHSGLGLLSLQNRADMMNGSMWIDSIPRRGTKYIVKIPLN